MVFSQYKCHGTSNLKTPNLFVGIKTISDKFAKFTINWPLKHSLWLGVFHKYSYPPSMECSSPGCCILCPTSLGGRQHPPYVGGYLGGILRAPLIRILLYPVTRVITVVDVLDSQDPLPWKVERQLNNSY